jgi:hypothetical protein
MALRRTLVGLALAGAMLLGTAGSSQAARIRYLFVPDPAAGGELLAPGAGERLTVAGWQEYNRPPPRPTQLVTFRHPATGQLVAVPLALPPFWTPKMEYVRERVIYNYSGDTVEVNFLADGSVRVIYSNGLIRSPER